MSHRTFADNVQLEEFLERNSKMKLWKVVGLSWHTNTVYLETIELAQVHKEALK